MPTYIIPAPPEPPEQRHNSVARRRSLRTSYEDASVMHHMTLGKIAALKSQIVETKKKIKHLQSTLDWQMSVTKKAYCKFINH